MGVFVLISIVERDDSFRTLAVPRGRVQLAAMATAAGVETRTDPAYSWDGMTRGSTPFVVLQHTLAGEGRLDFENRSYALSAGTTMLVRVPHRHRYFLPPGGSWRFFFLVLAGREALHLSDVIIDALGPAISPTHDAVDRLAGICLELLNVQNLSAGRTSSLAYDAVTTLFDQISIGTEDTHAPDWLTRATAHIVGNLDRPLPIADLAEIAGMSRAHFVRSFTRLSGAPPAAFVFTERMRRAARLLQGTDLTVADIARRAGYSEPNYFAKAFRRAFDVSPSEFRASGMYLRRPDRDE